LLNINIIKRINHIGRSLKNKSNILLRVDYQIDKISLSPYAKIKIGKQLKLSDYQSFAKPGIHYIGIEMD